MLREADFSSLQGLALTARRLVEGLYGGAHASLHRGPGVEFHDYRSYCPGDDPRKLDWRLFGRTDRLYVRRDRWFTDLHAYVMVDCTASMGFSAIGDGAVSGSSTAAVSKLRCAATLAAAIAFLAVRQSDRVGLGLFSNRLHQHLPIGGTWPGLLRCCHALEQAEPIPGPGDVGASLRQAHGLLKRRGLVVLISDLLDDPNGPGGLFDAMDLLRHDHFELIVFQILTPQELDLGRIGTSRLQLVDAETRRQVPTDVAHVRGRYAKLMQRHVETLRHGCVARGADHQLIGTGEPLMPALRRYLMRRTRMT